MFGKNLITFTATCLSPSKWGLFKMPDGYNTKLLKAFSQSSIKYQFFNH